MFYGTQARCMGWEFCVDGAVKASACSAWQLGATFAALDHKLSARCPKVLVARFPASVDHTPLHSTTQPRRNMGLVGLQAVSWTLPTTAALANARSSLGLDTRWSLTGVSRPHHGLQCYAAAPLIRPHPFLFKQPWQQRGICSLSLKILMLMSLRSSHNTSQTAGHAQPILQCAAQQH